MIIDPERLPVWPCYFGCNCALDCHPDIPFVHGDECYMTSELGLRVRGDCDCEVQEDGTIAISYPAFGVADYDVKSILRALVDRIGFGTPIMFHTIHYICTGEYPGPSTSKWPLVWNGLVQIDDDKLTFEFIERKDSDD